MSADFRREWNGQPEWEEVWFCELRLTPDRGLWVRYTLTCGEGPAEASVWATAFSLDGVLAKREIRPLETLEGSPWFALEGLGQLDASGCRGQVGDVTWDLRFDDRGLRHTHMPALLRRLPIKTRHWGEGIIDLRCTGEVSIAGERFEPRAAPAVLGHIYGEVNSLQSWAWAHCNDFEGGAPAVFEGLSARLDRPGLRRLPLTSMVLAYGGEIYRFSSPRQLVGTRATWGAGRWAFKARAGKAVLRGEAQLPDLAATARVRYPNTDGGSIYCANSRLSWLRLHLEDPSRGLGITLESDGAAFELGSRQKLADLHIE